MMEEIPFLVKITPKSSTSEATAAVLLSSTSFENRLTTTTTPTLELNPNNNVVFGVVQGEKKDVDKKQKQRRREHAKLMNSEPQPHSCSICDKKYKTKQLLQRHLLSHTNERPYRCSLCQKGFNRKDHLKTHTHKIHNGHKHSNKVNENITGPVLKVKVKTGKNKRSEISFMTHQNLDSSGTMGQKIITSIPKCSLENGNAEGQKASSTTNLQINNNNPTLSSTTSMTIIPGNILGQCEGIATLSVQSTPTQKLLVHQRLPPGSQVKLEDSFITLGDHGQLRTPPSSPDKRAKFSTSPSTENVILKSVCQICLKIFKTSHHHSRHMESCHSGNVRKFCCTFCDKTFKRKDHLNNHVKSCCPSLQDDALQNYSQNEPDIYSSASCDLSVPFSTSSEDRNDAMLFQSEENGWKDDNNMTLLSQTSLGNNHLDNQLHGDFSMANSGVLLQNPNNGESSNGFTNGTTLILDGSSQQNILHSSSDPNQFSIAMMDSFMQGNVTVLVVDEEISKYFQQQTSAAHLTTTTFPCGQCQNVFNARDQLIAHLQEHSANDNSNVLLNDNIPISTEMSFVNF